MGLLKYFFLLSLLIFPIAEIGRIQLGSIAFTINDIFLFTNLIIWIFVQRKKINFKKYYLSKPIFLFVGICGISLILNLYRLNIDSFFVSFLYLVRWMLYASVYFVIGSFNKEFIVKIKYFLLIPISIILGFGIIQYNFYQSLRNLYYLGWDEHLYRLFASFLDPNFAGAFLVISFLFLLNLLFEIYKNKNYLKVSFLFFLLTLNFIEIYLTFSRSALIMLVISLITYLVLIGKKRLLVLFAALLIVLAIFSPKSFQTEGTNLFRIASSEARLASAQAALKVIDKNLIFGVGFNAFRYVMFDYGIVNDAKWETTHAGAGTDNSFLFVIATTGLIGFGIFLYLLSKILALTRVKRNNKLSVVVVAVLIGLVANSMFINSLFYVYIMEFLWIYISLTENS